MPRGGVREVSCRGTDSVRVQHTYVRVLTLNQLHTDVHGHSTNRPMQCTSTYTDTHKLQRWPTELTPTSQAANTTLWLALLELFPSRKGYTHTNQCLEEGSSLTNNR